MTKVADGRKHFKHGGLSVAVAIYPPPAAASASYLIFSTASFLG
jgi:hypothetical protein